jgi:hypothetical protein
MGPVPSYVAFDYIGCFLTQFDQAKFICFSQKAEDQWQ